MKQSQNLPCILFCGSESPYGFPHLHALLDDTRFDVKLVVLPSPSRTAKFYAALQGAPFRHRLSSGQKLLKAIKNPVAAFSVIHDRFMPEESPTDRAKKFCRQRGVPMTVCDDANDPGFLKEMESVAAEYAFSAAYPQIFSRGFLDRAATRLAANSHPSLLPKYRGAHPVFWAIRHGETETGLTFHVLTSQLDQGAILAQVPIPICPNDDRGHVSAKIAQAVPLLTKRLADNLLTQDFGPVPQNSEHASIYRQDREIHHLIRWTLEDAASIGNLVRACGGEAFCFADGTRLSIERCQPVASNRNLTNELQVPPGTIVDLDANSFWVAATEGVIRVDQWSGEGFRPMIGKVLR